MHVHLILTICKFSLKLARLAFGLNGYNYSDKFQLWFIGHSVIKLSINLSTENNLEWNLFFFFFFFSFSLSLSLSPSLSLSSFLSFSFLMGCVLSFHLSCLYFSSFAFTNSSFQKSLRLAVFLHWKLDTCSVRCLLSSITEI